MDLIEHADAAGTIRVEAQDARTVILLIGEIDAALRDEASACMGLALVSGAPIVLDSTQATFIDSSGIAFVLQLHLAASEAGIPVTLLDPHRVLRDVLEMVGLSDHLPAEPVTRV
jgi:anti-anti-sigma factor